MRRALRRLEAAGLVETKRGRNGRLYRQRRRHRQRYLTACAGPGCVWCENHTRHLHSSSRDTLVAQQLRAISGERADVELDRLTRWGFHEWLGSPWNDFVNEEFDVAVTELHARRALTASEHRAAKAAMRAYIAARLDHAISAGGGSNEESAQG